MFINAKEALHVNTLIYFHYALNVLYLCQDKVLGLKSCQDLKKICHSENIKKLS
jgi:hypothetical protein